MAFNFLKRIGKKSGEAFFQTGYSDFLNTPLKVRPGDQTSMIEAYETWIYAAVSCIARSVAKCPIHLYKQTEKTNKTEYQEIEQHPFWDLWKNINPYMNSYDLLELTMIYLGLTGNGYWYVVKNKLGKPAEIYVLKSSNVRILAGTKEFIGGYQYRTYNGVVNFSPDEIIHFKYPNPHNEFYGLSPLQAMIYTVAENDLVHQYGYNILKNQAIPGNVFVAEDWVNSDMLQANKEEIRQEYEGVKKAGKTMILKGIKPTRLGLTPIEMSFIESRKFLMEEILAIYGVPRIKLGSGGTIEGATPRATAEAQDMTFQQETILPKLRMIESKINEKLLPMWDDKLVVEFENPVPKDREFELKEWEMYLKNYVMSINEYRQYLGYPPASWGDKPIAPFNLMPLAGSSPSGKSIKKGLNRNGDIRARKWVAWVKVEEVLEKRYIEDLKKFFIKQKQMVLANLKKIKPKEVGDTLIDFIFPPVSNEIDRLTDISIPHLRDMAEQGIHIAAEAVRKGGKIKKDLNADLFDLGMTPTTFDQYIRTMIEQWRDKYGFTIINTIQEDLRGILSQSISEGWTATQLQGAIEELYAEYSEGMTPARALRIARTETSRVMNEAELEAYKTVGEVKKTFCTALDEFVCPECADQDGIVVGIDEDFPNGNPPVHPNSYDKETEIFTKQGMKAIKDVKVGDLCLSLNPDTFKLEYVKVIKTYKHKAEKMIHFFNNQVDLMITEDHNVFYKKIKEKKWEFIKAKDLLNIRTGQLLLSVKRKGLLNRRKFVLTTILFSSVKRQIVNYNDWTYCVDLEKYHTLLTRRNGKMVWSGNCRCNILAGEWE